MAGETEVANMAAVLIGTESRLLTLDDDTFLGRTLKAAWAIQRQATLRDGSWNFAARRKGLAAEVLADGVPYPWQSSFPLPAESLRLIEVLGASRADYQLEGKSILINQAGPLYVRYAIDVPEMAAWDASAAEAFACRLAWKCGNRIAGSGFDANGLWAQYRQALARAKTVDAMENPPIPQDEGEWIEARTGYGRGWAVPGGRAF